MLHQTHMEQTDHYIVALGYRVGAGLIDLAIFLPLCKVTDWLLFASYNGTDDSSIRLLSLVPLMAWPLSWWAWKQTPGGWALSSQVVNRQQDAPNLAQAVWRFIAMWMCILPLGLGFWAASWDAKKRTWYDRLSATTVIGDASMTPPGEVKF